MGAPALRFLRTIISYTVTHVLSMICNLSYRFVPTLDPLPHIRREPFGMVVMPILSYVLAGFMIGWASAPYDPYWARAHRKKAALMAMAGPASNLALRF